VEDSFASILSNSASLSRSLDLVKASSGFQVNSGRSVNIDSLVVAGSRIA